MTKTTEDLETAFSGESQAYQKYVAFGKKAAAQGFTNIAKLFQTTADAELIHAVGHMRSMDMIGDTVANLQAAIDGETYEYQLMYPPMLDHAVAEDHKAKRMFGYAISAEEVHAQLYTKALEAVREGKDLDVSLFYLCPVCGYIELGHRPEECPVCQTKGEKFVEYKA